MDTIPNMCRLMTEKPLEPKLGDIVVDIQSGKTFIYTNTGYDILDDTIDTGVYDNPTRIRYPSICPYCNAPMHNVLCEYCGVESYIN